MTSAPSRHLFRFRLRTLFVVVTLLACWLGWSRHQVRERERMLKRDGVVHATIPGQGRPMPKKTPPLLWSLLGAEKIVFIGLNPDNFTDVDLRHYQAMFPEAEISRAPLMSGTLEIMDVEEESN